MDRKGLIHFKSADGTTFKWKAYRINLNNTALLDWQKKDEKASFPKILKGKFALTRTGDTYFNLTPFFKGYIWVNGQLLGRYWNAGPQHSLYCPGAWLKEGENTVQLL
jgi:beta-galactosidase